MQTDVPRRTTWLWLLDFTSDIIATIQLYNRNSAGAQFIIQAAIVILNTRIYAMIFAMTGEMRFPVL